MLLTLNPSDFWQFRFFIGLIIDDHNNIANNLDRFAFLEYPSRYLNWVAHLGTQRFQLTQHCFRLMNENYHNIYICCIFSLSFASCEFVFAKKMYSLIYFRLTHEHASFVMYYYDQKYSAIQWFGFLRWYSSFYYLLYIFMTIVARQITNISYVE